MKVRKTRLPEIIDILTHQSIRSQEELSKQLAIRGFIITQATLSRDLKLLKASKRPDENGIMRYYVGQGGTTRHHAHSAVVSVAMSQNVVVIKTRNGYASGLAFELDMLESPMILGTIPGADTVMVVVAEGTDRHALFDLLSSVVPSAVIDAARALYLDN